VVDVASPGASPARRTCRKLRDRAPKTDGLALLQKLYYDTALSPSEFVFGALWEFVPMSQVLFGSDFPYLTPAVLAAEKYGIESSKVLEDQARAAIDRENALARFPKFAKLSINA
jgi:6-methylsalicylate decarboxylase